MGAIYKNITGNTATDLGLSTSKRFEYCKMSFCNVHASDAVNIDLYLSGDRVSDKIIDVGEDVDKHRYNEDGVYDNNSYDAPTTLTSVYYILKNTTIPNGASLFLGEGELFFNNNKYKMFIKLNNADSAVDVIIDEKKTNIADSSGSNLRSGAAGY